MKDRLRTAGRIGTAFIAAEILLGGCAQANPTASALELMRNEMRAGVTIDATNFDRFFTKCSSKEQLLQVSKDEEKQIFPILIDDPQDITIRVDPENYKDDPSDLITANKPLTYISPINGTYVPYNPNSTTNSDFMTEFLYGVVKVVHSVDYQSANRITRMEVQVGLGTNEIIYKTIGNVVKKGDPVFTFISSPPLGNTGLFNTFLVAKAEDDKKYSSDLSTYASLNGKTLVCSTKEIPLPNGPTVKPIS